jgi:hypothetical protein
MSKHLDEHQREELTKAFLKAKDKEKMFLTKAKKFASENCKTNAKPFQHDIDTILGSIRNLIASSNGEVHIEWAKWKGVSPNPKKINRSYDFVVDMMTAVDYKGSKKQKELLAQTLNNRGGKEFLRLLHEKIIEQASLEASANRELELETLRLREKEIANMLSPITNFSIVKGEEMFNAWRKVLMLKIAFGLGIEQQLEDATGVSRSALKNIHEKTKDSEIHLLQLDRHLQVNCYADRLLSNWYMNDCFDELKEEHLRLCLGLAYAQTERYGDYLEDETKFIMHTHNSMMIDKKEIVFRDKYLDDQILYSPKNKYVKRIVAIGEKGEADLKKTIKKLEKTFNGRKLSYRWDMFFTNSITIEQDFIDNHKMTMLTEDIEDWRKNWDNLYTNLNIQTDMVKGWRAKQYRAKKKK